MKGIRKDLRTIIIAVVAAVTAVGAPAIAAIYADDSDRVDGKHAVGAAASRNDRAGKLVATNGDGYLPEDIIRQAPDAERLDGFDSRVFRTVEFDVHGARLESGAADSAEGITLNTDLDGVFVFTFMYPQDRIASSPVYLDLVIQESSMDACTFAIAGFGTIAPTGGGTTVDHVWRVPGEEDPFTNFVTLPEGASDAFSVTLRSSAPAPAQAGRAQTVRLERYPGFTADTCGVITVRGARVRY